MPNSKTSSKSHKRSARNSCRKSNPTYITERHDILDGEAIVLRTKQSKDVWQFRMRVHGEGAYYRESLRTRHLGTAIARGKNKWADITAKLMLVKKYSVSPLPRWCRFTSITVNGMLSLDYSVKAGTC